MSKKKQIEKTGYKRISKRAMAGVKPVILHVECEAKCEPIFKRCEYCDLEKELLNRLADLEDKIENGELVESVEKERLLAECENQSVLWRQHFESIYETAKETVKADTVRKMQERLLSVCYRYPHAVGVDDINKIAKELLGE